MQPNEISNSIIQTIGRLNADQKKKLLEFINSIFSVDNSKKPNLLKFAGSIEKSDLKLMEQVIHEDCEKIDNDEW